MNTFEFAPSPRILCRAGACEELGKAARDLGMQRALIVTDPGLAATGLLDQPLASLRSAGLSAELFDHVEADPPQIVIEDALSSALAAQVDGVIGFGGGSSMDTAKLIAVLAAGTQTLEDIYGVDRVKGARLPLIQIPTTAGTGSEVTPIAIVTTPSNEKQGVVSPRLLPDLALLDPVLTRGLPPAITAMTGIDAIVHAIEAYTSKLRKNPISDALARQALILLIGNIERVVANGGDIHARTAMLQGAMMAGLAFANAPVGAIHALAYPLGGHFHLPHGLCNALIMEPVLAFNIAAAEAQYAELSAALGGPPSASALVGMLRTIRANLPISQRLSEVGIGRDDLPLLASDAMKVTRLLVNNPRPVAYEDALALYAEAL